MSQPLFYETNVATAASLVDDYTGSAQNINNPALYHQAIQLAWSGTTASTGTVAVQVSNDKDSSAISHWTTLTLSAVPTVSGTSGTWIINLTANDSKWLRLLYTSTYIEGFTVTTAADVSGSLNNKYFLFSEVDGLDYYVWFNINSAGVDPAVAGRTGIQVTGATNVSAATLAAAIETAVEAATTVEITTVSNLCTAVQVAAGHTTAASAGTSAFVVTNAQPDSTMGAIMNGKVL